MRRFIFLTSLFLMSVASLSAQQVYRSEFSVFDTREDALKGDHAKTEGHIPFAPKSVEVVGKVEVVGQSFEMPTAWSDYNIYLHLQNTIKAYDAATTGETFAIVGDFGVGAQMNFPAGEEISIKVDELSLAEKDLVKFVGREYVGHDVVAPNAFVKLTKAAAE